MSTEAKKSKKRGRPKIAKAERRSQIVLLRVRNDEFKQIAKAAKAKEQTVSDWIRERMGIAAAE